MVGALFVLLLIFLLLFIVRRSGALCVPET
jgi:hypothetical protein